MDPALQQRTLDTAFHEIERSILPSLAILLDTLLDAAASARPGVDARACAAELEMLALDVEDLTRRVETLEPPPLGAHQGAARRRMSA